jgi:hypothetical protein
MDLHEIWKKLETEKLEVVKTSPLTEWPPKSKHPVSKLEQSFFFALLWIVFFEGVFAYLFIDFTHTLVRAFMGLLIVCYAFGFVVNYRVFKQIRREIDFSKNLFQTLSSIYNNVITTLRFQRRAFILIYPIAASAGFLLGFSTQKDPGRVIAEPRLLLIMIGASIAITPFGYWIARWLEKTSYDKYCAQLKALIDQIESTKE